jgi:meso-butanediol dehydrogenase / (S,S)-butanediol dehydrogenase / diacetyl reductase
MSSSLLKDRVIFLTGGAHGIGRECARLYAAEGAHVVVADLDLAAAREVAASLPLTAMAVACNVQIAASVEAAVTGAVDAFGRLDAVHNNAGIAKPSLPLHETDEDDWDTLMSVNLKSVYLTTKYAIEALKKSRGCILNTASMVGLMGQDNHAAYVATKGGMIALTKAMALDYAPFGIRVNAICPAGVWTDMLRKWADEQENRAEIAQYLDDIHALGRCPESDVVADAAVFLLSDKARFMTGCILPVSGGAELGYRRLVKTGWFTR